MQSPDSPVPQVGDFDLKSATSQEQLILDIVESMRRSGGCIVRNMVDKPVLDEIESQIRPHIETAGRWEDEEFYPYESRRVTGCLTKSKAYALNIVNHPIYRAIVDHFLTSRLQWNWNGTKNQQSVSPPQLSNTVVFSIEPGAKTQPLHRDDDINHNQQPAAAVHTLGRDTGATLFLAAKPSTKRNGATRFIPGSHLWDYSLPPPAENSAEAKRLIRYAELNAGDGFLMLSGCIHGAGANVTENEERLIYSVLSVRGYLRQEENQYLANDHDLVSELPIDLQRFAGWGVSKPYLGWVNFAEPTELLAQRGQSGDKIRVEGSGYLF